MSIIDEIGISVVVTPAPTGDWLELRLPQAVIERLGWKLGDIVEIAGHLEAPGGITIRKLSA